MRITARLLTSHARIVLDIEHCGTLTRKLLSIRQARRLGGNLISYAAKAELRETGRQRMQRWRKATIDG